MPKLIKRMPMRANITSVIHKTTKFCALAAMAAGFLGCESSDPKSAVVQQDDGLYSDYLNRDVRDDIFYFVLPDRFDNGDLSNDNGSDTYEISYGGFDKEKKGSFHGGDLPGLKRRLGYLKEMGVTAIWMTPILRNKAIQRGDTAYHGYWIVDFTQLDSHFGSNADLKDLIDTAHSMGMKVFFDIITNHTADVVKYRECHDESGKHLDEEKANCDFKSTADLASGKEKPYTTFIPAGEETVKVPAWLNDPKYYHNQGDSFWRGESSLNGDFVGLDDLNTEMPEVVDGMIDIYKDIVTNFKPDGFRVDTVKHVRLPFWQKFVPAIMAHAKEQGIPNFHMFGEVYDGNPAFLSQYTTLGKMPAILDFGFQGNSGAVIANNESPERLETLFDNDDYYNDADSQADLLLSFIGNHDMGRFGYFLNKNLPDASGDEKLQRSVLAHALMYFARGIPVVYYGDEQGFTGDGNDMAAREDMMPSKVDSYNDNVHLGTEATPADDNFDRSHPIYQSLKAFAEVYQDHRALRRGIHQNRFADKTSGIYAFSRIDLDEKVEYLLAFNSASETKSVSLKASAPSYTALAGEAKPLVVENGEVTVEVPALSFVIYKASAALKPSTNLDLALTSAQQDEESTSFIDVKYDLPGAAGSALSLLSVQTEYKAKDGTFKLAAVDYTAPYSAKVILDEIEGGLKGEVRVTVSNLAGQTNSEIFNLGK